jgi:hypothetical protein
MQSIMKLSTLTLLGLLSLTSPALANDCWIRAMDRADSVMDDIEDLGDELRSMSPGSSMYRQKLCLRINKFVRYKEKKESISMKLLAWAAGKQHPLFLNIERSFSSHTE